MSDVQEGRGGVPYLSRDACDAPIPPWTDIHLLNIIFPQLCLRTVMNRFENVWEERGWHGWYPVEWGPSCTSLNMPGGGKFLIGKFQFIMDNGDMEPPFEQTDTHNWKYYQQLRWRAAINFLNVHVTSPSENWTKQFIHPCHLYRVFQNGLTYH